MISKPLFTGVILVLMQLLSACREPAAKQEQRKSGSASIINLQHLDHLYVPVTFGSGVHAAGIYIYAEAPDYHHVDDGDEGFTCVDDVARAVQVYIRHPAFPADTGLQRKATALLRFIVEMQSADGYFYNFLFPGNKINVNGKTSVNGPHWWSWRALQTLTEAGPLVRSIDEPLAGKIDDAVGKLVKSMKRSLVNLPATTKLVKGITVPQWLPSGSATDQSAIIILGLIPYCNATGDTVLREYIKKLADGILMMQVGDSSRFPYSSFLSWQNIWHAYGNDQAYALFKAASFLNNSTYAERAMREVDYFYPFLLQNGYRSSFAVAKDKNGYELLEEQKYAQIAYGVRPMVFAACEAYRLTGQQKYADMAANIGAWLMGKNDAGLRMYNDTTGRCYDGITGRDSINYNSGAESTIEALLTLQMVENIPAVKAAFNTYK